MIAGLSVALCGCGKTEEEPEAVVDEKSEKEFKKNIKAASENLGEAAADIKEAADETAREIGSAAKDFGSRVGGAFKKAKDDLSE